MKDKELSLISLSKITTYEILIEEQIERLETVRFQYFKKYLKSQTSLKRRFLLSKIFGAVLFGILPVIPLLTYFQVLDFINQGTFPIEIILFAGSLLFGIFFIFQFLNFFLMAMLNTMKILSGNIFKWFETLPISREKLRKLILLTVIHSLDIPLIVITLSFPIIMLIGTQNVLIFLTSIGVSILETIFSLSLLILFSERLNRVLNINKIGSKKTHIIRLINLASYIIIVVGSVFLVQWALGSIRDFFILFFQSQSPALIVMILSMIPFPIAPGYLLSSFIAPLQIPGYIWYNIIIGFTLFLILTYLIYQLSLKGIKKSSYSKLKKEHSPGMRKIVKLKIISPLWAYIRKDLIIASRNLKIFLSLVMPIVIGFIFTFTYNNTNLGGVTPFQINFIFNTFVLIGFNIIISGMIVNGLLSMEEAGTAILASLPLIPREQANAKLILIFLIQTIAVIAPPLMYIGTNFFFNSLITALWALPFVLVLLFIMLELRIYLFGKSKHFFVIEEILPEKRIGKWLVIFVIEYFIYFLILPVTSSFYVIGGVESLFLFVSFFSFGGFILCTLVFRKIFSIGRFDMKRKEKMLEILFERQPTWFTEHSWITVSMLIFINIFFTYLVSLVPSPSAPFVVLDVLSYEIYKFIYLIVYNFIFILLWILIVPILLGVPYGKTTLTQFLKTTLLEGEKYTINKIIRNILLAIIFIFLNFFVVIYVIATGTPIEPIFANYYLYIIIVSFCFYFWQVFIFIGIILNLITRKLKSWKAIILTAVIYSIFSPRLYTFLIGMPYSFSGIVLFLVDVIFLFLAGLLGAFIYTKRKNLFIIGSVVMSFDFLLRFIIEYSLWIPP